MGGGSQWAEIRAVSVVSVASAEVKSGLLKLLEARLPNVKPFLHLVRHRCLVVLRLEVSLVWRPVEYKEEGCAGFF